MPRRCSARESMSRGGKLGRLSHAHDPGHVLGAARGALPPAPRRPAAASGACPSSPTAPRRPWGRRAGRRRGTSRPRPALHVEGDVAGRRPPRRVWNGTPLLAGYRRDLFHRLDGADLTVGRHHRDQHGLGRDGFPHGLRVDQAEGVHRDLGDLDTRTSPGVRAACSTEKCSTAETTTWLPFFRAAQAMPLTARLFASVPSRGEDYLLGVGVDERGHPGPGRPRRPASRRHPTGAARMGCRTSPRRKAAWPSTTSGRTAVAA